MKKDKYLKNSVKTVFLTPSELLLFASFETEKPDILFAGFSNSPAETTLSLINVFIIINICDYICLQVCFTSMLYCPWEADQIALFFIPVVKGKNANKASRTDKGGKKTKIQKNKLHYNMTREKLLSCFHLPPPV